MSWWSDQLSIAPLLPAEWSDVANDYVQHVLGYKWQDFKYKIYVVPPGDLCSWGGMGWVGCLSDCRAWVSGDLWKVSVPLKLLLLRRQAPYLLQGSLNAVVITSQAGARCYRKITAIREPRGSGHSHPVMLQQDNLD